MIGNELAAHLKPTWHQIPSCLPHLKIELHARGRDRRFEMDGLDSLRTQTGLIVSVGQAWRGCRKSKIPLGWLLFFLEDLVSEWTSEQGQKWRGVRVLGLLASSGPVVSRAHWQPVTFSLIGESQTPWGLTRSLLDPRLDIPSPLPLHPLSLSSSFLYV